MQVPPIVKPPIVIVESIEAWDNDPQKREWTGWIALAIVFPLLILAAIFGSYRESNADSKSPDVQETKLENLVTTKAITKKEVADRPKKMQLVVNALNPTHLTDEQAALVWIAATRELKQPIKPADLQILQISQTPRHREFASIYATPQPNKATLQSLAKQMPEGRFIYKLAKVQALEEAGDKAARGRIFPATSDKQGPLQIVMGLVFFFAFFGGASIILLYFQKLARGNEKWNGHPLAPASFRDADRLAVRAAQLLLLFVGASILVEVGAKELLGKKALSESNNLLVSSLPELLIILGSLLLPVIPVMGEKLSWARMGVSTKRIGFSLFYAVCGVICAVPLLVFSLIVGKFLTSGFAPDSNHPMTKLLEDPHNYLAIAVALFLASVQAPIFEELLFRGTLLPALAGLFHKSRFAVPIAMATSSLLFAALHPQGVSAWLALGSVGAINCVLTYQTKSLMPAMFMHGIYNGSLVLLTVLNLG